MFSRATVIVALSLGIATQLPAQETVGEKIKNIFSSPTPTPHRKKKSSPSPSPKKKTSPSATAAEEKSSPSGKKSPGSASHPKTKNKASPTPSPEENESVSPTATPSASPSETPAAEKSNNHKRGAPNASLTPDAIAGFEKYPDKVQKLLSSALELTTRGLNYKYGSADPSAGGMDCSGFVYYMLKQHGVNDVPRDSSEQYVWLRRAGKFEPVVSRKEDSFEFEKLKPGDLLFWTGTYSIERDPPITHAMIYLGREKKSGKRVMVGSSDGRTYEGQQRFGVSVFDFKMPNEKQNGEGGSHPRFVGYGHIPGISD